MSTRTQVSRGKKLSDITRDREAEGLRKQLKNIPWLNADKSKHHTNEDAVYVPATGSATMNHGLGRTPRGYIITDSEDGFAYRTAWDEHTITFYNAGNVEARLSLLVW